MADQPKGNGVAELEARMITEFSKVHKRFDSMDARFSEGDKRIQKLEVSRARFDSFIDSEETNSTLVIEQMRSMSTSLARVEKNVDNLTNRELQSKSSKSLSAPANSNGIGLKKLSIIGSLVTGGLGIFAGTVYGLIQIIKMLLKQ